MASKSELSHKVNVMTPFDSLYTNSYFPVMSYDSHMSIYHRLEVITGQVTLDRLKPTCPEWPQNIEV